jgi:hypothetical protein
MQPIIKPEMSPSTAIPANATNVISPTFACCDLETRCVKTFMPHRTQSGINIFEAVLKPRLLFRYDLLLSWLAVLVGCCSCLSGSFDIWWP